METQNCSLCKGTYSLPEGITDETVVECPHCGKSIYILSGLPKEKKLRLTTMIDPPSSNYFSDLENTKKRKEYKVLSQKDKWFSGKFDPSLLEEALNEYAKLGWSVTSSASADINSLMGGNRQELIVILEREV